MKHLRKPTNLPVIAAVLGVAALLLRLLVYNLAVDARNLLTGHPLTIALWVLSAAAVVWVIVCVARLDGSAEYADNFSPSLTAALGHNIGAAGIALTALLPWYNLGKLVLLRRVLGILAAAGLVLASRDKKAGKCPQFLTHLAVCVFLIVHMLGNYGVWSSNPQLLDYAFDLLGCVMAVLFAFYEAAFDVGMGKRRMQLAAGLLTAYFGFAALSGSAYPFLYAGCGIWALTDLCTLTPKPKKKEETA
ncbi:MAG: hypothetical protein PUD80_00115 [Firmicutes bacterium]|nr:hypothetical protein [Bacillota bacterium]